MSPLGVKVLSGAITGWAGAAAADYHAFLTWQSFDDCVKYNWKLSAFRWLQGVVSGAVTAFGIGMF